MHKDNVELICSVGELAALFDASSGLQGFLQNTMNIVAHHMKAAVCSIYLFDEETQEIVLRATQGLSLDSIDSIHLKLGEGISGTALKELRTIREAKGSTNPHFKYIPGSMEERYEAFLAVPIVRGLSRVGVLVLQDPQPDYFDENDAKALQAIAAQLATTIENAKLLMHMHQMEAQDVLPTEPTPRELHFVKGKPASEGVARGKALVMGCPSEDILLSVDPGMLPRSVEDFHHAIEETEAQLKALQSEMEERLADVASLIFSAHLLILKDSAFSGAMAQAIEEGLPPQKAIVRIVNKYIHIFSTSSNPRLNEKAQDVKDLGHRLLRNLRTGDIEDLGYGGHIVIAVDLLPSDILRFAAQGAEGLLLAGSGMTSHALIFARSLRIPVILVDKKQMFHIAADTPLLMDAHQGSIFVDPGTEVLEKYEALQKAQQEARGLEMQVEPRTLTRDGTRVRLLANINLLSDLNAARALKAEGIGLYRSEFPFIVRNDFPSEEEQYRIYRTITEEMEGRDVVFRTLDIGGDKMLSYSPHVNETNPFLGLRAIRFSLRNKDIFSQQLRALLRAGADATVKIMFPLISSVDDFIEARQVVAECTRALQEEGVPGNPQPELGVMIELPSAVAVIDELAREADFLCIGTNDLIQYMLAVDRTNAQVSDLYLSHHPAVLRAIKKVANAAARNNVALSICGEAAANTKMIPFLLGVGIRTFSVDPHLIPRVQRQVAAADVQEASRTADRLLRMGTVSETASFLGI